MVVDEVSISVTEGQGSFPGREAALDIVVSVKTSLWWLTQVLNGDASIFGVERACSAFLSPHFGNLC